MAKNMEFDVSELDDYTEQMLNFITQDFPKETKKFMRSEANKLKNKAKRAAKSSLKSQPTGGYVKGLKAGKKVYAWDDAEYNVRVYNSAPHAHQVDEGHNIVTPGGRMVGYAPGKHILENSAIAYQEKFRKNIEIKLVAKAEEELGK